ncbi:MAG: hypothetical protein C5B45_01355 [Chlamydiae bacterium]|nr:MAG: hypothetical protein C5B45_01355 [Chlamydiota bacterium]
MQNEVLVFLYAKEEMVNLTSLERLNTTLNSIIASDEDEPFVMVDFGENEQALQTIELNMKETCLLKEKIEAYQTGTSSKDSWLIYLLEKALILPVQVTASYLL